MNERAGGTADRRPRLVFVSPLFLFPNDAGGKIRSTNILRGLKGGFFHVTLVCPATTAQTQRWSAELAAVCDDCVTWHPATPRPRWRRALDVFGELPVSVAADRTPAGLGAVAEVTGRGDVDVTVFDFVHAAVLRPPGLRGASVCFTHNVEAEIYARHAQQPRGPLLGRAWRWLWSRQHAKMARFEGEALRGFTHVVAVSERDARHFRERCGVTAVSAIPTGVDLQFFGHSPAPPPSETAPPTVVFTGSMDWPANIDGVKFFLDRVWPRIVAGCPAARFVVVGRHPPASLLALARGLPRVEFTGFVDDVRPWVHAAHAFVIPLFVGGGTRIKAFEAMAMGCPVVSTTIGIEGLDAEAERHYLRRDDAEAIADAVLALLADGALRRRLAKAARDLVEQRFGHAVAARAFEAACRQALADAGGR